MKIYDYPLPKVGDAFKALELFMGVEVPIFVVQEIFYQHGHGVIVIGYDAGGFEPLDSLNRSLADGSLVKVK